MGLFFICVGELNKRNADNPAAALGNLFCESRHIVRDSERLTSHRPEQQRIATLLAGILRQTGVEHFTTSVQRLHF